ncbi:MAG: hypothetical protein MST10_05785 [Lentisphaeria bacterium]|nr:hypothetical protein [Lentisphaeria bacterium]
MKKLWSRGVWELLTGLTLLFTGCQAFEDIDWDEVFSLNSENTPELYKAQYVLSFHQVVTYPTAQEIEKPIETPDGTIWINMNQFFSSKNIKQVKVIPDKNDPNKCRISLRLDDSGKLRWLNMATRFQHEQIALLINGEFHSVGTPSYVPDEKDEWVIINRTFDVVIAENIKKYAADNYKFLNPSPTSLF